MDSNAKTFSTDASDEPAVYSPWLAICPGPLRTLILYACGIRVVRFLFVSTVSTLVDYAILFILNACLAGWAFLAVVASDVHRMFGISVNSLTIATFLAVAAGYLIGTLVNFVMARRIVFHPSGYHTHIEFVLVAIVAAVGFALTEWITLALNTHQHWNLLLAKTAAVVIVFFWNFFARRLLIYRTTEVASSEQ